MAARGNIISRLFQVELNSKYPMLRLTSMGRLVIWIIVVCYLGVVLLAAGAYALSLQPDDSLRLRSWAADAARREREGTLTVLPEPAPPKKALKPYPSQWKRVKYVMKDGYVTIEAARGGRVVGRYAPKSAEYWRTGGKSEPPFSDEDTLVIEFHPWRWWH